MIKAGDTIKIRWSTQLDNLGASNLVGKKALVVNAAYSENGVVGVIVKVKKLKNSKERFIPIESVETAEQINRLKSISILKFTDFK